MRKKSHDDNNIFYKKNIKKQDFFNLNYVDNNKLYTGDNKQVKCFHFIEGLGGRSDEEFNAIMNDFKYKWFNDDTIKFFKEQCGCPEFFN